MSCPVIDPGDIGASEYIFTHVFCPLQPLPRVGNQSIHNDYSLASVVAISARLYRDHISEADMPHWQSVSRMLDNLRATMQSEGLDSSRTVSQFSSMDIGDVLTLFIRAQNAGVTFRKQKDVAVFESFELSPLAKNVMATEGRLVCSYPGPAIEIPSDVFYHEDFLPELVNFLVHMNHDDLDDASQSSGTKDSAHPRYITELLTGILRGVGRPSNIPRISKRVRDVVVSDEKFKSSWRRSPLWLLIRVALQTTLDRSHLGRRTYKEFMLFFICLLAEDDLCVEFPNHLLLSMTEKISRRLLKLGSSTPDWLARTAVETCTFLRSIIETRWREVQAAQRLSPPWTPSLLDLARDTQLSLLHSKAYLSESLLNRHVNSSRPSPFSPHCLPRGTLEDFLSSNGALFEESYQREPYIALYDVEQATVREIDSWVGRVTKSDEACVKLEILAYKYSSSALKTYANNPEPISIAVLTMMELWIALDKLVVKEIPMLADYSPEVPITLLEQLLICKSASLCRLSRIHQYLTRRHSRSRRRSVFSSTAENSFAVRFYRKSLHLQRLKVRIEEEAKRHAHQKATEMHAENQRYCDGHYRNNVECRIDVHEWPLPADQLEAEKIVFELDCPISFNMWRSITFHLFDLLSPSIPARGPNLRLDDDASPLKPYYIRHPRSRISLGSNTRPSWRLTKPIPAQQCCIRNGLTLFSFDTHTGSSISVAIGCINSRNWCTYKLQSGPYHSLQQYVDFISHTSNEVIANQADCARDLSIHEYMAFGHLRSGGLLQWLNILRELRGRSLSFRRSEVHMLLAQAVSQVGPLDSKGLTWHQEIRQPAFCTALLGELRRLIHDIKANWLEGVTMDSISFLLRRLLVSSPDGTVTLEAIELLRTLRSTAFIWIQELTTKLAETPDDKGTRDTLRDTAVICRSTFDVDTPMISKLLHSAEDVEILLSSAILIREHFPSDISQLSAYSRLLLERDVRLSLALENVLNGIIQADHHDQGINLAVHRVFPGWRPDSKWSASSLPDSRWFSCKIKTPADRCPQTVHLNILDGSLLVNGRALGIQLPNNIVRHPLYKTIFGEKILQVIPSGPLGMDYSTKDLISEHRVYFSLEDDHSRLVIRAKREQMNTDQSEIIELIPREIVEGDLPAVLVEGHIHWLNLSTSVVEIRPLDTLWEASSKNWRIDYNLGCYHMRKGQEFFVDIQSQSWKMVSSLFKPLCSSEGLIVSTFPVDPSQPAMSSLRLSVFLPQYDLSFYVDEDGDLQSRNMQGMIYDENQSVGTLFGLTNQLVLRPKHRDISAVNLIPRCVLIPDGKVSFETDHHHVRVEIATTCFRSKKIVYRTYKVDTDLGCLAGNAGLTNKLYCAYLHAITSGSYNTDPLTGRSGIEEALSILQSAGCWSTVWFSPRDAELLSLIASISSQPKMLGSRKPVWEVEQVGIPPSNLHELYNLSKAIKKHYERVVQCCENQSAPLFRDFPFAPHPNLKGTVGCAAYLFLSVVSEEHSKTDPDLRYHARDLVKVASKEHCAYTAATSVYRRHSKSKKDIREVVSSWRKKVCEEPKEEPVWSLRYDKSWLAPDLLGIWFTTYDLLRKGDKGKWFQLLFSLPAMAYASKELSELVPIFVAFAEHRDRFEDPPPCENWELCPSSKTLRNYVIDCAYSFGGNNPEGRLRATNGKSLYAHTGEVLRLQMHRYRIDRDATQAVKTWLKAWPCEYPPQSLLSSSLYDVEDLQSKVESDFSVCFHNFIKLKEHLTHVQKILNDISYSAASPETFQSEMYSFRPSEHVSSCVLRPLAADRLFTRPAPPLRTNNTVPGFTADENTSVLDSTPLDQLLARVEVNAVNPLQHRYVSALRNSAEYFVRSRTSLASTKGAPTLPTTETLLGHYALCRTSYIEALHHLQRHLGPSNQAERVIELSGQWPCITAHSLFRSLASNSPVSLSDDWKRCLIKFTFLALELQRARRLFLLHSQGLHIEFCRELQNEGCEAWDPETCPDWLLIQLEGNFLVRRVQAEVANEMISPHVDHNTTMQLNMGEGKSSVIVPIVAAVLADGKQLVRVIIPKPLAAQTLHILTDRLGGLGGRRIYYLPFSRTFGFNQARISIMRQIMLECMQERGILVLQPEHILSLKLVTVENVLHQPKNTSQLVELHSWLHSHSRDILDESDEILDVRSHLVFTIGQQQRMEGSPERWTTIQQVLSLVSRHALSLQKLFPLGVEYEPAPPGSFPHFRILQADAGHRLISWIVQDIMDDLLPKVSFEHLHFHSALRDAIRSFISCDDVPPTDVQLVKEHTKKTHLWGSLLLLRGLLNGILLFALGERRWRVDYGLFPTRTMLAVPYQAKDVPAPRAEFGHPDIAIILTCLSYYYGGLSEGQLKLSFEILLRQPVPSSDYQLWIRDCQGVPESLQTFNGINPDSVEQWNKLLSPLFSRNQATIDFYLSKVVFPRAAVEFPSRLSASGWDLAEKKERLLTGFSGTNDGQYLLPLHITQCDLDHQRGTNAKVLSYLLQSENKHYMCTAHENSERRTALELLHILVAQRPEIRVLLDVGAQMLELKNVELAKAWLDIHRDASAAIYFDEDDELMVRTRDGGAQLLRSSPFAQQLDRCIVYLDDAHTRGTDIKFPIGFRAAVTLGPKVTKDRLVQGCMRMRKLGHDHSIMFFAPLEVDRRIRSVARKSSSDTIDTTDILHWCIQETWENIRRWAPHWVQQGIDHSDRYVAWSRFCGGHLSSEELMEKWLEPEAKSLEELYEPRSPSSAPFPKNPDFRQRCVDLGVQSLCSIGMDEEQEREIVYEIRRERQVERPQRVPPVYHSIHQDVVDFIKTGVIPTETKYFRKPTKTFSPAFNTLDGTSAATNEAYVWGQSLLATKDFEGTVELSGRSAEYVRPVHWIISAKRGSNGVLVILSPYEVNSLLPAIKSSKKVHLHLYTPRMIKSMKPCDDFSLYNIPSISKEWVHPSILTDQLNVFAGQLYLKDYETYLRLSRFLCMHSKELEGEEDLEVEIDGFILPRNRIKASRTVLSHTFASTPTTGLRALMYLRSRDVDFTLTHMGKLLHGKLLSPADFDH